MTPKAKGVGGLFWNAKKAVRATSQIKADKVGVNVDAIASSLEGYQVQLLKDISLFNHLYDMNTEYFKELDHVYPGRRKAAGRGAPHHAGGLKARAAQSGDAMDAQRANDMAANCDRFEKSCMTLAHPSGGAADGPRRSAFCKTMTVCWWSASRARCQHAAAVEETRS